MGIGEESSSLLVLSFSGYIGVRSVAILVGVKVFVFDYRLESRDF